MIAYTHHTYLHSCIIAYVHTFIIAIVLSPLRFHLCSFHVSTKTFYFLAEWRPGKCKDEQSKIPIKKIKLDNEGKFGNGLDDCENLCSEQPLATACEYNTQTNECFYHTKTISTASEDQTDNQFMCSIIQKKGLL